MLLGVDVESTGHQLTGGDSFFEGLMGGASMEYYLESGEMAVFELDSESGMFVDASGRTNEQWECEKRLQDLEWTCDVVFREISEESAR